MTLHYNLLEILHFHVDHFIMIILDESLRNLRGTGTILQRSITGKKFNYHNIIYVTDISVTGVSFTSNSVVFNYTVLL